MGLDWDVIDLAVGWSWAVKSPQGERWAHVVICSSFYPTIPLSSLMPGTATLCPCPGQLSGALFLPSFNVYVSVFTCAVACRSVCPVLARGVFNNVRSVAFSRCNKGFLTNLKDLSLIEPMQGNRNSSNIKRRGTKDAKDRRKGNVWERAMKKAIVTPLQKPHSDVTVNKNERQKEIIFLITGPGRADGYIDWQTNILTVGVSQQMIYVPLGQ